MKDFKDMRKELGEWMGKLGTEIPGVMKGFGAVHAGSLKAGVLDVKTKELLSLAIAISARCDGCIAFHTHDAMKAGATKEEIAETVGVAILMGGGPSVVYGIQAMQAAEQFS